MLERILLPSLADQTCLHLACESEAGDLIGFASWQINRRTDGSRLANLSLIMVDPAVRRRGVGTRIMDTSLIELERIGVANRMISGLYPRLFPGVPSDDADTIRFFSARGWTPSATLESDLFADLSAYRLAGTIRDRMQSESVTIRPAESSEEVQAAIELQAQEFPGWLATYRHVAAHDPTDILMALDNGKVIGTLIMCSPQSNAVRGELAWRAILGANMGSMGEVGVAKSARGRGIGVALVAYGAEVLHQRGVGQCIIGWTTLADFYGKVGFEVWRQYVVLRRGLDKLAGGS